MVDLSLVRAAPVVFALSALLAFGCGSTDSGGDGGTRGEAGSGGTAGNRGAAGIGGGAAGSGGSGTTEFIGPEGGVVTGEQGVTVTIPPGALDSETAITTSIVAATGLPAPPTGTTVAGPFVALTPHGTQFATPVEITLPYTSSSGTLSVVRVDDEFDTTWETVPGASFSNGVATLEVRSFSILAVATVEATTGPVGPEGGVVAGDGGITVIVPPEALQEETLISATIIDGAGLPALPEGMTSVGPFISLTPHGTYFSRTVSITVPYSGTDAVKVLRLYDENSTSWEDIGWQVNLTIDDGVLTLELYSFSILTLAVVPCETGDDCSSSEICSRDACDGPGFCRQPKYGCEDRSGVCGCDGRTYRNQCDAEQSFPGTNVASTGPCVCAEDSDCAVQDENGSDQGCVPRYTFLVAQGTPGCDAAPRVCLGFSGGACSAFDPCPCAGPVCGCDGVTYNCSGSAYDVGFAFYGLCDTSPMPGWAPRYPGSLAWLRGVWFNDASTGTVVGTGGTILQTADGGTTWATRQTLSDNQLRDVWFADETHGTAVGRRDVLATYGVILRTIDGGATWVQQESGVFEILTSVSFSDASNGVVVGTDGTVLRTVDGGNNWETIRNSDTASQLNSVFLIDADNGTAVGQSGTVLRTTNGGASWSERDLGTPSFEDVWFTDASTGTIVGSGGTILRTTNGGDTWEPLDSGTTKTLRAVSFVDQNIGTVVGDDGTILRTTNGGASWIEQESGTTHRLEGVWLFDADAGIAIGDWGTMLGTADGGGD